MGTLEQKMIFPRVKVECELDADAEIIFHPGTTEPFLLYLFGQRVPLRFMSQTWEQWYEAQVLFPAHPQSGVRNVHCSHDEATGEWFLEIEGLDNLEA